MTGGNFLGTPALEASYIIESLVGTPPVSNIKNEITLEDVIKKLESIEKNLPNLLDSTSKVDESLGTINERIAVLETSTIQDNQNLRIGELEEAVDVISSTFTSIKTKRQKAFVGKEQKLMYVRKVSKPKPTGVFKTDNVFSELGGESDSGLFKKISQELRKLKSPVVTNHVLEEAFDELDIFTLGNT